jgi:hypothetical protein
LLGQQNALLIFVARRIALRASHLPIADGRAANITNRSADQASADHLAEAAACHHADAGTERAPATAPF